jgi:homoserine dehydrogenase
VTTESPGGDRSAKSPYRIALLGLGTVARGVLELLTRTRAECEIRAGRPLDIVTIAVRDPSRPRDIPADVAREILNVEITSDPLAACRSDAVDVVVELVGGVEMPRVWITEALEHGKDVVTANKAVLAEHGEELFALARDQGRRLLFEASVAGAVPILQAIQGGLPSGQITSVTGILNGTCNHLLGAMERGVSYETALASAQEEGLAEADPHLDVSGLDAAHKLALIARILTGRSVDLGLIRCQGIEGITPVDLDFGARNGWVLKLLAVYRHGEGGAALGVYPAWIERGSPLSTVNDEYNGIHIEGEVFGSMLFVGKGAGGLPTGGSVVADIIRAARGEGHPPRPGGNLKILDPFAVEARYCIRFDAPDRPGVLARIAGALGGLGISIAAAEQRASSTPRCKSGGSVPIHIITHPVLTSALDRALAEVEASGVVAERPLRIRVEEKA